MTDAKIVEMALQVMALSAKLCAPMLLTGLALGFAISLFQSVTHIQEATVSFVPKLMAVAAAILFTGNWLMHEMIHFTEQIFVKIPSLLA